MCVMLGHETIYIDFMGHENSKKSVPGLGYNHTPKYIKILYNIK